ncbi:aminotransferase class III-fold pyridoxal phosphate-dependent enzyme [Pseudomonas indica]|uniref:aminotransferase class III-fold pyridoxal phosphate-dependent enzyme n=1 Tax=Pseudomonas indica TaxID=137658 RepID=UPI003FD6B6C5
MLAENRLAFATTTDDNRLNYQRFVRPLTGRLLEALRLDVEYVFGEGDTLEYFDEHGERVQVYDFLGGYGALLFGHNHPQLVDTAIDLLRAGRPFAVQASLRGYSAQLGRKLNDMLQARLGREYVTTLANSGTEAAEAALKHAQLAHRNRKQALLDRQEARLLKLRNQQHPERLPLAPESARLLRSLLGEKIETFAQAVTAVRRLNRERFLETGALFCCLNKSYHGKTAGAVNLTENELYRSPFVSIGPSVLFVDRRDPADFEQQARANRLRYFSLALDEQRRVTVQSHDFCNIAALFVEPIQGEGGVHVLEGDYLAALRRICDEHGIHLVFDEIQSGMGRTGHFLASEPSGVRADCYLLSKSLGGGLAKIASVSIARDCFEEDFSLIHTSTFAEDDFSSAIALRGLELLESDRSILRNCREVGAEIKAALLDLQRRYPEVIAEVRGEGLMLAIEFADQSEAESHGLRALACSELIGFVYAGYLLHEHRIRVAPLLSNNNVLRLEPAACVGRQARQQLYAALDRLCLALRQQHFHELVKFIVGQATPGRHGPLADYRGRCFSTPPEEVVDRTVGFLMHFVDASNMHLFDPSCEQFSLAELEDLLERCYLFLKPFRMHAHVLYSKTGKKVRLQPFGLAITSEMIQRHMQARDLEPVQTLIETGIDKAVAAGCEVLGFGGFTSIVMQNCKAVREETLAVTTGNSLTVGMGYEALLQAAAEAGIDLDSACFAAIGANGNIGSLYCELMAEKVPSLVLIGRPGRERALQALAARLYAQAFRRLRAALTRKGGLVRLAEEHTLAARLAELPAARRWLEDETDDATIGTRLYHGLLDALGDEAPVRISTDPADICHADLILGASNQAGSLILAEYLRPGPVVICDVALPADTHPSVANQRPDVRVIKGGLVRVPPAPDYVAARNAHLGVRDFLLEGLPIPPEHVFACMGETLLMGLTGITSHYSRGDVRQEQVREMLELARLHGFTLGDLKTGRSF